VTNYEELAFAFITDNADEWPVAWMCEALEVSVSGYYARATRADSPTEAWRQELVAAIEEIHADVKQRYGSPRMTAELNARVLGEYRGRTHAGARDSCERVETIRSHDGLEPSPAGGGEHPRPGLRAGRAE
jgi:hypothetical protein